MPIEEYFQHEFVVVRAPLVEGRYGPRRDWANATRSTPASAWIIGRSLSDPAASAWDELMRREPEISYWVFQGPADTDLESTDRLEAHGQTFTIVGRPLLAPTRTGVSHLEALLKNVEG